MFNPVAKHAHKSNRCKIIDDEIGSTGFIVLVYDCEDTITFSEFVQTQEEVEQIELAHPHYRVVVRRV
jgi:hypothetical protein